MDVQIKDLILENPVFRSYLYYTGVLALKMMLMTLMTIGQRIQNNAFFTDEDASYMNGRVSRTDENVERVRRGHRNDMESIYLFLLTAFAYVWTNPDPYWANLLFLSFTVTRFIHTFVYTVTVVPQPARGLAWLVGFLATIYMAVKTVLHFHS